MLFPFLRLLQQDLTLYLSEVDIITLSMFKKLDGQINVSNQTCIHMSVRLSGCLSLVFVVFQWMVSYVVSLVLPSLIMTKNNPNPVEKRKQNGSNETKPNQPTTSNWRLFQSVANLSAFFGYPHKSVHPSNRIESCGTPAACHHHHLDPAATHS